MKCWKCGGHMSRSNGHAYCDNCNRSVSYKTNSQSTGDDSSLANGCLIGCLAIFLKYILITGLVLIGIIFLAIIVGVVWLFVS